MADPKTYTSVESALQCVAASDDIGKWLSNVDLSRHVVDWIVEETDISRWKVVLAMKIVSPVIVGAGKASGGWLSDVAKQQAIGFLKKFKWCDKLIRKLSDLSSMTTEQIKAKEGLKEVLADKIKPADVEYRQRLSQEIQLDLRQLETVEGLKEDIAEGFGGLEALRRDFNEFLNPQPIFKSLFYDDPESEKHRFVYRSRFIPFVGREMECERLAGFLNTDKRFSWLVMTGAGGAGKSRLALEFCLRHGGVWRAGILLNLDHDFSKWQPDRPAFFVVDYASANEKRLEAVLETLAERRADLRHPVRMLLLDREAQSFWVKRLYDRPVIALCAAGPEPWRLNALEDDGLWEIMRFFFENAGQAAEDRSEHLERLARLDPRKRPLFAAYYADAVAHGHYRTGWDKDSLLRDVIRREKNEFWTDASYNVRFVTESDEALLALATLTHDITSEQEGLPAGITALTDIRRYPRRFTAIGGSVRKDTDGRAIQVIPPWEPDIVGELFVLDFLADDPVTGFNAWRDGLVAAAWALNGFSTTLFIERAVQDFPEHVTTPLLFSPPPTGQAKLALWCLLAANYCAYRPKFGEAHPTLAIFEDLKSIYTGNPGNQNIVQEMARAAYNLALRLGKTGWIEEAQAVYADIRSLARDHPDNQDIALDMAKSAYNLALALGKAGRIEEAQAAYADIHALAQVYPGNQGIALRMAQAAYNLTKDLHKADRIDDAKAAYADIQSLVRAYPGNQDIALEMAKATHNLALDLCNSGRIEEAQAAYADIRSLARDHPDNQDITLDMAKVAVRLAIELGNAGRIEEAKTAYVDIQSLARAYPSNQDITLAMTQYAMLLTGFLGEAGRIEEAMIAYTDIHALAQAPPDNQDIALWMTKAAYRLAFHLIEAGRIEEAKAVYADIKSLAQTHPNNQKIILAMAKVSYSFTLNLGKAGQIEGVKAAYVDIKTLGQAHPGNQDITLWMAEAAINFTGFFGEAGRIEEAMIAYADIHALAQAPLDNQDFALSLAKAASNLAYHLGKVGRTEEAKDAYADIRALTQRFPENQDIAEIMDRLKGLEPNK